MAALQLQKLNLKLLLCVFSFFILDIQNQLIQKPSTLDLKIRKVFPL